MVLPRVVTRGSPSLIQTTIDPVESMVEVVGPCEDVLYPPLMPASQGLKRVQRRRSRPKRMRVRAQWQMSPPGNQLRLQATLRMRIKTERA
jgi:hypothetical protein